jgi:16S rRNA (cytosine967-C5)-methyltransferase
MSSSAEIRARAAESVAQVVTGRSLDAIADVGDTAQERGLFRTLAYDSVRWYVRLDALLIRLLARPQQKIDPDVRALAIVGLCQLLYTEIPPHAAVAETVNAARVLGRPRAAGLLNAILRRCQREGNELLASIDGDIALRTSHPRWFVAAIRKDFPSTFESVLDANNARPPFWLRVNRLHTKGSDYQQRLEAEGISVAASLFDAEALLLERAVDVDALPGFRDGDVSVQDAAAQLAARLVAPQPGERVLDACAAPGGKTCHLLELQPQLAELVAIDVASSRLERVQQNLSRLGLQAHLVEGDAEHPERWWDGKSFNRILLDVPCSATGVIRRHPDIKLLRRASDIAVLAERQANMLARLWPLLEEGGRLVYASCSALRAENAAVIGNFLNEHREARDVTRLLASEVVMSEAVMREAAGLELGLKQFATEESQEPGFRIAAGTADMDGFYYACLEKTKG